MNPIVKNSLALLAVLALLLLSPMARAVGQVVLTAGNISITGNLGGIRIPAKGEALQEGDTLATGKNGELVLRMDDHGLITLRPNSRLKIEVYKAQGTDDDRVELRLFAGSFRSITGWIGREHPARYVVHARDADIRLKVGCDHEPMVVSDGPGAGVYDKVNCGATVISGPNGDIEVTAGNVGFIPAGLGERPTLLPSLPQAYGAGGSDAWLEEQKAALEKSRPERHREKQKSAQRNGMDASGKPRIADFQDANQALAALEALLRAYEQGNVEWIRARLDPSMIGLQRFLDDMFTDTTLCKQMRIHLLDTQVQAGPELAIVQTSWEKRCVLVPSFTPVLITGHGSFFLHRGSQGWRLVQAGGSSGQPACTAGTGGVTCTSSGSPLTTAMDRIARTYGGGIATAPGVGGAVGTLVANGPALTSCPAITAAAVPTPVAANIVVNDPDQAGAAQVRVVISNAQGERETVVLLPAAPGGSQFSLPGNVLTVAKRLPTQANAVLEQLPGVSCIPWTVSYADPLTPAGPQDVFVVVGP